MDRRALSREQVLDRSEHEPLVLEHRLAGEDRRDDADRVVAAAAGDGDLGIGDFRDNRGPDRIFDGTNEVGGVFAHDCWVP